MIFELLQAGFAIFGERDIKTFGGEKSFETFADFDFVIDNEDGTFRHGPASWLREIPAGTMCLCLASSARRLCPRAP